jgi:formylglycine-generating enzyme required for sulfatase activity
MMKSLQNLPGVLLLILIVLLAACNLQTGQQVAGPVTVVATGNPISPGNGTTTQTEQTASPTEQAVVFGDPEAGTAMLWMDSSYVVYVPASEFVMGKDETETKDHSPAHPVSLDGFWIQQAEVTNAMYALCVSLGVCTPPIQETGQPNWYSDPKFANAPVVSVDWNQAGNYCDWIEARLPTEAEWEKAARGTEGATYPWGETEPTCNLLNFKDCLATPAPEIIRTYPKGASPYKLADMAGNVFEWVFDRFAGDYYSTSPASNPTGPSTGEERVVRGSSYLTPAEDLGIYLRSSLKPELERSDLGFRCVLTGEAIAKPPTAPVCTLLPYNLFVMESQWQDQPTNNAPAVNLQTYCKLDNQNNQYGTAIITLEQGTDPGSIVISSPQGSLNCNQDPNDPLKFNCAGSALKPGKEVMISVCSVPMAQPVINPTCPVFYHFDAATNLCQYGVPIPVACADPDVVIFGYGCLPAPQNGECPVGSYSALYNNNPVCIPAGGPKCQGLLCPAACPAGLVFNEGNFCCDYPTDVKPTCPPDYLYDVTMKICVPDHPIQAGCTNIITTVETCAPPPETCTSFSSESNCKANLLCKWNTYASKAGGYCTNK